MKAIVVLATVLGSLAVPCYASDSALQGLWVLTPEAQETFTAPCRGMTLEFTADNRLVRTTGELTYITAVAMTVDGSGWLLKEALESQNGKPGCGGKAADEIVSHLRHDAYVEVDGSVLRYYRIKGAKKAIEFKRADTQAPTREDARG